MHAYASILKIIGSRDLSDKNFLSLFFVCYSISYVVTVLLEMHDCCIRVTALLEYFEWTLSKQHSRSKGVVFCASFLTMLAVGVNF